MTNHAQSSPVGTCSRTCPHPDVQCPSDAELCAFSLGNLALDQADRIADTIDICAECETFVTQCESQSSDRFVDEMLGDAGDNRFRDEAELHRAMEQVAALGVSPAGSFPDTIDSQGADNDTDSVGQSVDVPDQPTQFGEYRVTEVLGKGGMGVVYRGHHTRMKRDVAIKVLPAEALKNQSSADRFHREVEAAAKLMHPNIVTAFDAGQHRDTHYLVMELVDGQDLGSLLKEQGPLPVETAVDYILQAARGLQYAHEQGVVHRDIKPANLLVDRSGTVKILDLRLASVADGGDTQDQLTKSGQVMGTVDYMAPEQATDTHSATAQSDIYSLGCTLFRLLTDKPIYPGAAIVNKLMAHANEPIPDLIAIQPEVPATLQDVFQKMVAKQPADRFSSMADVIVALAAMTPAVDGQASAPPRARTPQVKPSRAKVPPRVRIVGIAALAGVILLGILLTVRFGDVVVTVEAPDGKLPDDVKLLLKSDGQEIEITAADQWQMKVSPGQYGVEIQGGNDQFAVGDGTMTVSRAGKNILTVRRKSAADTFNATPAASGPSAPASKLAEGIALNKSPGGERHKPSPADAEVLSRLAEVDWQPGKADDKLRGVVASPAAIDGIAGSWQIRHALGYYRNRWLSPKGNYVVLAHQEDPTGVIFEVKTGRPVGAIHVPDGRALHNCTWSSDETHIAYHGHESHTVHIASRDGVSETSSFEIEGGYATSIAWVARHDKDRDCGQPRGFDLFNRRPANAILPTKRGQGL